MWRSWAGVIVRGLCWLFVQVQIHLLMSEREYCFKIHDIHIYLLLYCDIYQTHVSRVVSCHSNTVLVITALENNGVTTLENNGVRE